MKFSKEEKKILVELICHEQAHLIACDCNNYTDKKYKQLEELKVKVKSI